MRALPLAIALSALLSTAASAQDKVTLRYKHQKGEVTRQTMDMSSSMDFGGMTMDQEMTFVTEVEVTAVDDEGVATLKMTYKRVKFAMSGPMESEYDSEKDEEPTEMMGKMMSAYIGQSFSVSVDARGKVKGVKGTDKLVEAIKEKLGDEGAMMPLEDTLNDEVMAAMIQTGFLQLPEDPVAVGGTWKSEADWGMPGMGSGKVKNEHTLKSVDGGKAAIETKGVVEAGDEGGGGMIEINEAKIDSKATWDLGRGDIVDVKNTTDLKMTAGGQEMSGTQTMKFKNEPAKKADVPSEDKKRDEKKRADH